MESPPPSSPRRSTGRARRPGERIALFNKKLKRIHNEPLRKQLEQIESQVDDLTVKASIYDEMRQIGEHTDPEDIRAVEGSVSMTGALMAAAMASYDLSCGLVDDKHIERYDNVITALEERMGFGAGMLSVQTEVGELVANAKKDGISVGMNLPGGKCVDIAFVVRTRRPATSTRRQCAPSPTTDATRSRITAPTCISTAPWSSRGRRAPRRRRTSPAMWPRRPGRQPRRARSAMPTALTTSSTRREA